MNNISLKAKWLIKAPLPKVFEIMTDFEKWPEIFPKVAKSIQIVKCEENNLEIKAIVKSFGQSFPVKMQTQIISRKGFISNNESPQFGTSGHEEFFLSEISEGTLINYTYQV